MPALPLFAVLLSVAAIAPAAPLRSGMSVHPAAHHDTSAPLSLLASPPRAAPTEHEPRPFRSWRGRFTGAQRKDPVRQSSMPLLLSPATARAFDGIGDAFVNLDHTSFSIGGHPPDTDGDVGPHHYVQIVNTSFAVFDKAGTLLYGAVDTSTLWSGFGGSSCKTATPLPECVCELNNDGDGVVLYDSIADRWFITQFAVPPGGPWMQCIAVSASKDPQGSYHRYAFTYTGFNDYGKFGVWPDAYYATFNMFADDQAGAFLGSKACAYDRANMLQGNPALEQCFDLYQTDRQGNALYGGLLPTDLDGPTLPPAGAPNLLATIEGATQLQLWKFHVDWTNNANSSVTGSGGCTASACPPIALTVAPYTPLCYQQNGTGTCVKQKNGSNDLDSLADRPMFRISYRRFADHESLLFNHSIVAGPSGGVRWYELRDLSSSVPTVYQQGTWAPDGEFRWMGSMAMDGQGGIALGYSKSGTDLFPGISFTARNASDPPGQMSQGEGQLTAGAGAQNGGASGGYERWGDYSDMSIDPVDDCTFWYTQQYIPNSLGQIHPGDWRTTIASFQLPSCLSYTLTATPATVSVGRGDATPATVLLTTGTTGTAAGTLDLSATGLPAGVTAVFSPSSVQVSGTSTLSLSAAAGAVTLHGVPVTLLATLHGTSTVRTSALTLEVLGNEFALSAGAASIAVSAGSSRTLAFHTSVSHGTSESIAFAASAPPAGLTASFSPASVSAGSDAVLTLTAAPTAEASAQTLTVSAVAANSAQTLALDVTVLTLPVPSLLLPTAGSKLTGTAMFSLSTGVSAGTTLAALQVVADGSPVGTAATTSPANLAVDTTRLSNGTHQFTARATDQNGGVGESAAVSLNVDNPTGCASFGGGGDLAGLVALLALLRRASAQRPNGSQRRGRRSRPDRPA